MDYIDQGSLNNKRRRRNRNVTQQATATSMSQTMSRNPNPDGIIPEKPRSNIFDSFNRTSHNMADVKQKLYLRLLIRLTEKFGSGTNGKLIKLTLDSYLIKNPLIDVSTYDTIVEIISSKL